MQHYIDIPLSVGILLIAFRGLDFFFLPHQQDSIHSYFSKLQNWLQSISEDNKAVKLRGFFGVICLISAFQLILLIASLTLVPFLIFGLLVHLLATGELGIYTPEMGWSGLAIGLLFVAVVIVINMLVVRLFLSKFYVTISAYPPEKLSRLDLLMVLPTAAMYLGYKYLSVKFHFSETIGERTDALIFVSLALLLYFIFSTGTVLSVLSNIKLGKKTIAVRLFLLVALFFVRRIATYQKGALAGIVLIGTITLGTIKLFF